VRSSNRRRHLEHVADLQAPRRERRTATGQAHSLADRLAVEAKVLADLKIEKAAVEGERRKVEADLGPVRFLATLVGADNETVLRWFILVVALLLDPPTQIVESRQAVRSRHNSLAVDREALGLDPLSS
jgi:hypothetical protein